jgi:hypothetical protein
MVFLKFSNKTFVRQSAVLQKLGPNPAVKGSSQIPGEIPSYFRLNLQTSGDFNRNFLEKFRGARTVV